MAAVRRLYLSLYNWLLFAGWSRILYSAVDAVLKNGPSAVYPAVEKDLQIWQTAALLEILNSILGIVRSPVSATLPQIASRIFVTWGILWSFPETRGHWLVVSLILSWGLTEVIRYIFFGLKEAFGLTPSALVWLRYSTFIVLYPTGILSEAGLIYVALPYIKSSDLYSLRMPNTYNFAFDYYWAAIYALACYVPGGVDGGLFISLPFIAWGSTHVLIHGWATEEDSLQAQIRGQIKGQLKCQKIRPNGV